MSTSTSAETTFEKFYPRDETARIVHLHPRTLTLKAQKGEIEATRVGNKNLYSESAIRAFLARGTSKVAPVPKPSRRPKYARSNS